MRAFFVVFSVLLVGQPALAQAAPDGLLQGLVSSLVPVLLAVLLGCLAIAITVGGKALATWLQAKTGSQQLGDAVRMMAELASSAVSAQAPAAVRLKAQGISLSGTEHGAKMLEGAVGAVMNKLPPAHTETLRAATGGRVAELAAEHVERALGTLKRAERASKAAAANPRQAPAS